MTARARNFHRLENDRIGPNYTVRVKFKQRRIEVFPTPWNPSPLCGELDIFEVCVNVIARSVPHAREIAKEIVLGRSPGGRERLVYFAQAINSASSMCQLDKSDLNEVGVSE